MTAKIKLTKKEREQVLKAAKYVLKEDEVCCVALSIASKYGSIIHSPLGDKFRAFCWGECEWFDVPTIWFDEFEHIEDRTNARVLALLMFAEVCR